MELNDSFDLSSSSSGSGMSSSMNSPRLFFFKSEHDSIFPCSEIIDIFKLFIKLGADSHLACIHKNVMLNLKN